MSVRKAVLFVVGLVLTLTPAVSSSDPPSGQSSLTDLYKTGPIRLEPDPEFGKDTKWNLLFFNLFCDLAAAPDGSLFIADSREHKVFKFDKQGHFIKSFGQKGQGPGDFNSPDNLSVLDGKYLVVGEYAESRRISLFDLEGKFNRLLATKRSTFNPVALRDGKVAYLSFRSQRDGAAGVKTNRSVVIRGIDGPGETVVAEHTFNWNGIMLRRGGAITFPASDSGDTFIAATKDGNLLVGNSLKAFLEVYSPAGVKLSSIDLGLEPIPVTKDYIKRYKDRVIGGMRKDSRYAQGPAGGALKEVDEASFDQFFSDHLPFYHEVLVDAEGNILVFKKTECLGDCPILIRVYSPEGKFICETEIQEGRFGLSVDPRRKNMVFGRDGLIAMVEVKGAEEFELRVIRVSYKPVPR
jgi:6-bladed beta-propeller